MDYATVKRNIGGTERIIKVTFVPEGWNKPYKDLHEQTPVGLNDMWQAESYNNFNNAFARAMQDVYDRMNWFALITSDKIIGSGKEPDSKDRLKIKAYVSRAGTEAEAVHADLLIPPSNEWYVPTNDGMFHPDTGVPFETVPHKEESVKRWEKRGFDPKYVSKSWRPNRLEADEERYVTRAFFPVIDYGRFLVGFGWLPSDSGYGGVASLPAHKNEPVFEVSA